jgi:hypothetical protein
MRAIWPTSGAGTSEFVEKARRHRHLRIAGYREIVRDLRSKGCKLIQQQGDTEAAYREWDAQVRFWMPEYSTSNGRGRGIERPGNRRAMWDSMVRWVEQNPPLKSGEVTAAVEEFAASWLEVIPAGWNTRTCRALLAAICRRQAGYGYVEFRLGRPTMARLITEAGIPVSESAADEAMAKLVRIGAIQLLEAGGGHRARKWRLCLRAVPVTGGHEGGEDGGKARSEGASRQVTQRGKCEADDHGSCTEITCRLKRPRKRPAPDPRLRVDNETAEGLVYQVIERGQTACLPCRDTGILECDHDHKVIQMSVARIADQATALARQLGGG